MRRSSLLVLSAFAAACSADPNAATCEQANQTMADCMAQAPRPFSGPCEGDRLTAAQQIVAGGCDAIANDSGRADGAHCTIGYRLEGLCPDVDAVKKEAKIPTVADSCAQASGAVCDAMKAGKWEDARKAIADRLARGEELESVISDPGTRVYLRERMVSLLAWNLMTQRGTKPADADYRSKVDSVLTTYYPLYDPSLFAMAHDPQPPQKVTSCAKPQEAVVMFPGVVRLISRKEFQNQIDALKQAMPCLAVQLVDTPSFMDPGFNVKKADEAVAAIDKAYGPIPLHLIGYSQGASNALRTLADRPGISARVLSLLTLDSAAHGSEVANTMDSVVATLGAGEAICEAFPSFAVSTCKKLVSAAPSPSEFILDLVARAMSVPVDDLKKFLDAEHEIAMSQNIGDFFQKHVPGVHSLTTTAADEFWKDREPDLPTDVLYTSFRGVITDPKANLPGSNEIFFWLLRRYDGGEGNDMQVRLVNQSMRGGLVHREVLLPAAEGNHWQWEINPGAVSESTMSSEMTKRTPQAELFLAYFEALHDVGIALGGLASVTPPDCGPGASPAMPCDDGGTAAPHDGGAPPDLAHSPTDLAHPDSPEPGSSAGPADLGMGAKPKMPAKGKGCDFAGDLAGSTMPISLGVVIALLVLRRRDREA
jgi:pimeloyl-ACP methyl ester carboxylesterase